ncbi:schlafen family member 13-like [Chanos chanos]|uniref:Schlafen family member 13-like n=1 Tax=Chanos chanos TaxID=29144 RepID=A0A6J2WY07_CHACN|nr:schlafen family member 13-like [Chanos chanos]
MSFSTWHRSPAPKLFPDLEIHLSEMTFGEPARRKVSEDEKKKNCELQKYVCALLNSGGGIILVDIKNIDYESDMGIGLDIEQGFRKFLDPSPVHEFIKWKSRNSKMLFFVKSWHSSNAHLCSIDTGIKQRSGTSVLSVPNYGIMDFIKKKQKEEDKDDDEEPLNKWQKLMPSCHDDEMYQEACQFYEVGNAQLGQQLHFGESVNIELKSFQSEKNLQKRLKEVLPVYMSAFANTGGGIIFIGVDDKTKTVTGCGAGMNCAELENMVRDICEKSKTLALHFKGCTQKLTFAPEFKIISVSAHDKPLYVVAVKISGCCCVVFEDDPNCWQVKNGKIFSLTASEWLKEMQPSDTVEKTITNIGPQSLMPRPESDIRRYQIKNPESEGVAMASKSWAAKISQTRKSEVISEALVMRTGSYPTLYCYVERGSPELWEYARQTAFQLKQKLVNLGGYTEWVCVVPQLVHYETGENIETEKSNAPKYPHSYLVENIRAVEKFMQSLTIVLLSISSPYSDKLGCEYFNLLTEEQFKLLNQYNNCKHLFVHGAPGTGKTLVAMEKIRRIEFMRRQKICRCETRVCFMESYDNFSAVQHIIVDEGQNFRDESGDWFKKAKELTEQKEGTFWIFLDYFQQTHVKNNGLPPLSSQFKFDLHRVVRNGTEIFDAMKTQLCKVTNGPGEVLTHLSDMAKRVAVVHKITGEYKRIQVKKENLISEVVKKVRGLTENSEYSPGDIAVLFSTKECFEESGLDRMLWNIRVPYSSVEDMNENSIVVDSIRRFSGLERDIVLLVDITAWPPQIMPNLWLCGYSRARIKLFEFRSEN